MTSILVSFLYCGERITHPLPISHNPDEAEGHIAHELTNTDWQRAMPIINFVLLTLSLTQWVDYLKTTDSLNKYIKLLFRSLNDIAGFLVIFMILQLYFIMSYYVLGATFDDGGNFNPPDDAGIPQEYDTLHNDFPMLQQWIVYYMQVLRTSIGDLQPPSYDYWVARYDLADQNHAQAHIGMIWIVWVTQILVVVICMLNFLIAIVSDSYNYIVEREEMAKIERQEEISYVSLYDNIDEDEHIYAIVFASDFQSQKGSDWEGATKVLK